MPTSSTYSPVKIGLVGLGNFGQLHAATLAGLAEVELVALVDSNIELLPSLQNQFPTAAITTDLDQAITDSDAEAWIVAASTSAHIPLAKQILTAGKPVLLEKPLAPSLAEAQQIAPLVNDDSSNLMLGHILLFSSEFRQLQQEVARRGPIAYLDCVRHRPIETLASFPGESPFHLTMVHDLYMAQVLLNRQEPITFHAQVHRTPHGQCDLSTAQLQWPDGTLASFTASFMTPAGMPADGFDRLEAFGSGWVARMQANPRPLTIWDDQANHPLGLEISTDTQPTGMLAEQLRCFCQVVRGPETCDRGGHLPRRFTSPGLVRKARIENSQLSNLLICLPMLPDNKTSPSLAGKVYLNTAAEGIPPQQVNEALIQYAHDKQLGMDGRPLHEARWQAVKEHAAVAFGFTPAEIGICSCSSEAYNLAALALQLREGDEVIINDLDFPAGATPWLQPACPATVKIWRNREGALRVEDLLPLLSPQNATRYRFARQFLQWI